ncbi:19576_t:CDS:2 [Cetraspora pellucida]|uniref:19576_t:CDS:1 n=1 Tax=Cetraspora pellucida TaxID=1433469 RepID=A0A9N9NPP0_9GLOM|nr:19576_t:CDS:2 [Cetraspora pellucida]
MNRKKKLLATCQKYCSKQKRSSEKIQIKETSLKNESANDYKDISEFVHDSLISLEGSNNNYESDTLEFYMNFDVHLENKESTKYKELGCQIVSYIEKEDKLSKLKTKNPDINKQRDKPTQLQ